MASWLAKVIVPVCPMEGVATVEIHNVRDIRLHIIGAGHSLR